MSPCILNKVELFKRVGARDGWIKKNYKMEMKFWAVLGRRGCREKKLTTAISMQLFWVVFSTFCGQKKIRIFFLNILASTLKSYII